MIDLFLLFLVLFAFKLFPKVILCETSDPDNCIHVSYFNTVISRQHKFIYFSAFLEAKLANHVW